MSAAPPRRPLSIYLVAGEESGDALGAALARALTARGGEGVKLAGVGGRAMAAAGIVSPFPIDDLSIIGISGLTRRLPTILRRIRETADAVVAARPDVLVIIDSPDFTHRVARRVRGRAPSIPIVDYVSPTVWAWRPWRARAMRAYVDCVLAILPFEPAAHVRLGGPPCLYVGHPLVERIAELRPDAAEARRRGCSAACPGPAGQPVERDPPLAGDIRSGNRARRRPDRADRAGPADFAALSLRVRQGVAAWPVAPRIVVEPAEKWAAFRMARAALAASGTVTLELALSGVPTIAAYRVPLIEEIVMRLHSPLETVILANLVIGERIVPEFLQRDCRPQLLAEALKPLLAATAARLRQIEAFEARSHHGGRHGAKRQGSHGRRRYCPPRPPRARRPSRRR